MTKKQIGFYCPIINNNSKNTIILETLNNISINFNTILFNSVYSIINDGSHKYSILHCNEARYFYGTLFVFDIDAVSVVKSFPGPEKKIFVASDIFWQNKKMPVSIWNNLIKDNIEIITHDEKIYDLYSTCFKQPLYNMINDFNQEELNYVIQNLLRIE